MLTRRNALKILGALPALPLLGDSNQRQSPQPVMLPAHLSPGDRVGLINPAGAIYQWKTIRKIEKILRSLDLVPVRGKHLLDTYGYLAGTDADRVQDIHDFFDDPSITALIAARGGWGCNRLLPLLDFQLLRRHPKIIMGYSDITSLLVAVTSQTGLVTFHGPVGVSTWNEFTLYYVRKVLFEGQAVTFSNMTPKHDIAEDEMEFNLIRGGSASGKLWGGNLSVLSAMVGSEYLPDPTGTILFVEDVDEDIYRIDRMLTQLKLAGILEKISGFIFAQCTGCTPENPDHSLSLMELMNDHIYPLDIPSWIGFLTGHISNKFTLPIGLPVTMDADRGVLVMNQPAVV
ncbi:MAG: LD-carboxypeptidase [FCB group bacterium]|nr:LD-carboxypeptidase [FCB group bacterium]